MTSKRGSKSKSIEASLREMAKASGLEVRPSRSRVLTKVLKGEIRRLRPLPFFLKVKTVGGAHCNFYKILEVYKRMYKQCLSHASIR
jgi:hypothetical protein